MSCKACGVTVTDHPHKIYVANGCDPECVPIGPNAQDGSGGGVKFNEINCNECAALLANVPLGEHLLEAWGDLAAKCAAQCIIPGSTQIATVTEAVKNKNKNIAITAIIIIVFLIIAVVIYTW